MPSVSYEFTTAGGARGAGHEHHGRAGRDPDAGRRGAPADRAPVLPAQAWATGLDATSDGGPGWRDYLEQSYQHVWAKDFWGKEIYLGVRLGQRGMRAQLSGGVLSQFIAAYRRGERRLGLDRRGGQRRRDRQVDRTVRTARPGAVRQRAGGPARDLRRARLADSAHADGVGGRAGAVRDQAPAVGCGGDRDPLRGAGPQRPDHAAAGAHGGRVLRRVRVLRPVPGRDVVSRTASRGCTTPIRCRSRSRSARG